MKKNKLKIIMIFLSVLLLITLFPFSVFADSNFVSFNKFLDSTTQPNYTYIQSNGQLLNITQKSVYILPYVNSSYNYTPSEFYYAFSYNGGSQIFCVVITDKQCKVAHSQGSSRDSFNITASHNDYYYGSFNLNVYYGITSVNMPVFTSIDDCLDSFDSYISSSNVKYPYTFQNGYLFVYDLGQSNSMYSFDLSSKSEEYSNIGSIPFPDTNQCYWFDNSLPEIDETTIPSSSAINIDWSKGSKTNIFGQTQEMVATISGTSSGRYLYVYNPPVHYKWSGSSNPTASEVVNYPVTIDGVSSGDNFYIYDSYARLSDFNQGGKVTGTITGTTGYGSVSTDGAITVVTSEGAIFNQTSGGSTDISGANGGSLAENINGLKETLDNFLSQFVQLLSAPISHIRQLISASHEFLSEFSHFFDWLPSEVSGFVISAFIVMVAIGIFKLFL